MGLADELEDELHNGTNYGIQYVEDLQRTEQWFSDRAGKVTGSITKGLMSCTASGSKKYPHWDLPEKIVDFGEGFRKIVYKMAMEKRYNTCFESIDALAFRYGRLVEPYIIEQLNIKYPQLDHVEVGSIDIIKGVFSSSPDGKLVNRNNGNRAGFEAKAAMTPETVYVRMEHAYDHKHQDFWQTQSEMLALGVNKLIYATSLPAKKIQSVLDGDEITPELIPEVLFKTLDKSETHCKALLTRAEIAGKARDLFISGDGNIDDCIRVVLECGA